MKLVEAVPADSGFLFDIFIQGAMKNSYHPNMASKKDKTKAYVDGLIFFKRDSLTGGIVQPMVAFDKEQKIGILITESREDQTTYLTAISVLDQFQNMGYGKQLFDKFLSDTTLSKTLIAECRGGAKVFSQMLLKKGFKLTKEHNGVGSYELNRSKSNFVPKFKWNF